MNQDGVIGVNGGFVVNGVGFSWPFTVTFDMMLAPGQSAEAGVPMVFADPTAAGLSGTSSVPAGWLLVRVQSWGTYGVR